MMSFLLDIDGDYEDTRKIEKLETWEKNFTCPAELTNLASIENLLKISPPTKIVNKDQTIEQKAPDSELQ